MARYVGVRMTKLTHHIIKNLNPHIQMNVNLSRLIENVDDAFILSTNLEKFYSLAKRLGMDSVVRTSVLKDNYDKISAVRKKHGIRSIQLTLDLIMSRAIDKCEGSETTECERIRQLAGISKAKKGWL